MHTFSMLPHVGLEKKSSKKVVKEQKGTFKKRNMKKKKDDNAPLTSLSDDYIISHLTHLFDRVMPHPMQ